jgi:RNA polymerase nonessential primary-like sigma factor
MINSAPQDQLTFDQELELGTRIQAGLRAKRMARYIELQAKQDRNSEEAEEFEGLVKEFQNAEILDQKDINFLIEDGKEAKDDLVLHNIKLVVFVAKRYQGYRMEMADLVQEGIIGCMTAADKYDPQRGFKFSTCAVPWINQQIYRFVMQGRKAVRLPAHVVEGINHNTVLIRIEGQNSHFLFPHLIAPVPSRAASCSAPAPYSCAR